MAAQEITKNDSREFEENRTMRKLTSIALMASLACLVGFAQDAKAGATIDLLWRTGGDGPNPTNNIGSTLELTSGAASTTITLDIFLNVDVGGIAFAGISLEFDGDGANELNALSVFGWGGFKIKMGAFLNPLSALNIETESGGGGPTGEIQSFSASISSPTVPGPAGTYHIGTAVFHITANTVTDGADIISGLFAGTDFISNGAGLTIAGDTLFGTATVNHVPEPGTASLLGLGLVGLILAGRRRSS